VISKEKAFDVRFAFVTLAIPGCGRRAARTDAGAGKGFAA
jgi:hypothetical protein